MIVQKYVSESHESKKSLKSQHITFWELFGKISLSTELITNNTGKWKEADVIKAVNELHDYCIH